MSRFRVSGVDPSHKTSHSQVRMGERAAIEDRLGPLSARRRRPTSRLTTCARTFPAHDRFAAVATERIGAPTTRTRGTRTRTARRSPPTTVLCCVPAPPASKSSHDWHVTGLFRRADVARPARRGRLRSGGRGLRSLGDRIGGVRALRLWAGVDSPKSPAHVEATHACHLCPGESLDLLEGDRLRECRSRKHDQTSFQGDFLRRRTVVRRTRSPVWKPGWFASSAVSFTP